MVIEAFDGTILTTIDDNVYQLKEVKKHKEVSLNLDFITENVFAEKKVYIPSMSHPWKASSFKKQIEKAHTNHVYA